MRSNLGNSLKIGPSFMPVAAVSSCWPIKCARALRHCAFVGLLSALSIGQALSADQLEFDYRDRISGRPAHFYELSFAADQAICLDALALLNEPQEAARGYRLPDDHGRLDAWFFLKTTNNVAWEERPVRIRQTLSSGEISERQSDDFESSAATVFNDGRVLKISRMSGYLNSIWTQRLYVSPLPSAISTDQDVGAPVIFVDGVIDLTRDAMHFRRVSVGGQSGPYQEKSTIAQALEHSANDYSYFDVIRVRSEYFVLMLPGRTEWFNAEAYKKHIRIYLLRSLSHTQHQLVCELKSRYREVLRTNR